jgi:hypothetical protein
MKSRAERVVFSYLKISQTENTEVEVFNEKEVQDTISEALDSFYPTYINSKLRNLSMEDLLKSSTSLVKNFGNLSEDLYYKSISGLKNKILNSIGDSALSDQGSLKTKYLNHFKLNPTNNVQDIEDYIKKDLSDIVKDTQRDIK